jgi:hypothetical protein
MPPLMRSSDGTGSLKPAVRCRYGYAAGENADLPHRPIEQGLREPRDLL